MRFPRLPAGTTTTTHPSGPRTACQAHQRACVRHWIWLGRAIQIDLTAVPEIIHAHQDAFRLACRYGVTRFVLAEVTVRQQAAATPVDGCPHVQRRIAVLASSNPGLDSGHPDTTEAAAYPETIAMAAEVLRPSRTKPLLGRND